VKQDLKDRVTIATGAVSGAIGLGVIAGLKLMGMDRSWQPTSTPNGARSR
jgi:hypothetical protein